MTKSFQILLLFSFSILFGQTNFSTIDSVANSTKYNRNLNELVNELTQNLTNDVD